MGPPSEVTGGIFQDLASFAIFFDLREAHFQPRPCARSQRAGSVLPFHPMPVFPKLQCKAAHLHTRKLPLSEKLRFW